MEVTLHFEPIDGTDSTLSQESYGSLRIATIAGSDVTHIVDPTDPGAATSACLPLLCLVLSETNSMPGDRI